LRVVIRYYRRSLERIGPILLEAYRLERKEERTQGDLLDIVSELSERYANTPDALVEAVLLDSRGEERGALAYTAGGAQQLLFPRPARLLRIYLVDDTAVSVQAPQPVDRLPSYTPREEVYVYAGSVGAENPKVVGVLLETDKGTRLLMLHQKGVKKDSNSSKAPQ